MTKKRTSKSSLRRELMARERKRMEEVADHLTTIAVAVDEADQASLDCAEAVMALKKLDKSIADIESATGIPAKRINQMRRNASALADEKNDAEDEHEDNDGPTPDNNDESYNGDDSHNHES